MMRKFLHGNEAKLWRENEALKRKLNEKTEVIESALVELGELFAEQDDAIIELAELVEGE